MRTIALAVFAAVFLFAAIGLGQEGPPPVDAAVSVPVVAPVPVAVAVPPTVALPAPSPLSPWTAPIATLCALLAYAVRRLVARDSWLHERIGAVAVVVVGGALAAALEALTYYLGTPAPDLRAAPAIAITAALGALSSLLAAANPRDGAAPRAPAVLVLLLALCATGCAPAWSTVRAVAESGRVAVAGFEVYDHAHKREVLEANRSRCALEAVPRACLEAALEPYKAKREPVLAAVDALAPVLAEASTAMRAATEPGADVIAVLAARVGSAVAVVLSAIAALRGAP